MEITENGLLYLFLCPSQGLKQKLKKKKKKYMFYHWVTPKDLLIMLILHNFHKKESLIKKKKTWQYVKSVTRMVVWYISEFEYWGGWVWYQPRLNRETLCNKYTNQKGINAPMRSQLEACNKILWKTMDLIIFFP